MRRREVSVFPQFVVCRSCGAVCDTVIVEVDKGKVRTKCPNCGSEDIVCSY